MHLKEGVSPEISGHLTNGEKVVRKYALNRGYALQQRRLTAVSMVVGPTILAWFAIHPQGYLQYILCSSANVYM